MSLFAPFALVLCIVAANANSGIHFQSRCIVSEQCDPDGIFACVGGICQCPNTQDMVFTEEDGIETCRIKIGKVCSVNSSRMMNHSKRSSFPSTSYNCSGGSICDAISNICSCPLGMYLDITSNSCRKKLFGENCTSTEDCDTSKLLSCINGICTCEPINFVLNGASIRSMNSDGKEDHCAGKVGTPCLVSNNKYCVYGAKCSSTESICKCDPQGWQQTEDKICGKLYGAECSIFERCSDNLVCTAIDESPHMKCTCPNAAYQIYESSTTANGLVGSCRGLVHTPCDPVDSNSCVENAQCVQQGQGGIGYICECKAGFSHNAAGHCEIIEYGYPCDYRTQKARCDKTAGLQCRIIKKESGFESICSCPNLWDVYDSERNQCLRRIGVACNVDQDCANEMICADLDSRTPNNGNRCQCGDGFVTAKNGSEPMCKRVAVMPVIGPVVMAERSHVRFYANRYK